MTSFLFFITAVWYMDPCTAQDVHTACSTTKLLC